MRRLILIPFLIVVLVLAIACGIAYWLYNNYTYYSTDDAQVNGQLVNINSIASGQLVSFNVTQGENVTAGEKLGTISATTPTGAKTTMNVTSPINGVVVQTSAVSGQAVSPGLSLAEVTNTNNKNIIAYVDESTINNIKVNQTVNVHVDAYSGTSYTGHVQQIVQSTAGEFSLLPTEDNASGNFTKVGQRIPVLISLDSDGGTNLMPGMSAEVTVQLHSPIF